ncbi:uncharacterized protein B0P05DRAFT_166932 [Gilbertella persicaria]|uniref:uncharacterized protein n=1 Tax=Gilbertella persicaria TaxID=101096 RepID=UPI00221EA5D3|nr:uncharacterized protein B0P05DRAFT_166932 [Gilbertella persicaria]KAI8094893.1 hypothetical protein B0P05DRAFT_166932 [Gilbertella persicaria]
MSNSGPSNLVEKLKQIAEKRNNLQADIELRYLEEATSIATDTRSAKRQKTTAKDAVKIPGLNKTLGESLLDLIPFKEKQSKKTYISTIVRSLSKNMIIDLTDASSESQLRWFSVDVANKIKEKYIIKKPEFKDNNIDCLLKKLNKAKTPNSLSRFLNELESFKSNDLKIKSVKRIYEHILVIHTERNWLLSKESRSHLTEFDYQVKFWGPIFESFFSSDSTVLHWGDTMSTPCKKKQVEV